MNVAIFLWNNKSRYTINFTIIKGINCNWNMIKMMLVVVPYDNDAALITICKFRWEKSYNIYIFSVALLMYVAIFLWNSKSRYAINSTIVKVIGCDWNMMKMLLVVIPYENDVTLINLSHFTIVKVIGCDWSVIKMMLLIVPYENDVTLIYIYWNIIL